MVVFIRRDSNCPAHKIIKRATIHTYFRGNNGTTTNGKPNEVNTKNPTTSAEALFSCSFVVVTWKTKSNRPSLLTSSKEAIHVPFFFVATGAPASAIVEISIRVASNDGVLRIATSVVPFGFTTTGAPVNIRNGGCHQQAVY